MNSFKYLTTSAVIALTAIGLLLGGATVTFACHKGEVGTSKPHKRSERPTLGSVDTQSKTITVTENRGTKTYNVDGSTTVTINGAHRNLADLKKGMVVSVATGSDHKTATKIEAKEGGRVRTVSKRLSRKTASNPA
jgi:hypothetical protein